MTSENDREEQAVAGLRDAMRALPGEGEPGDLLEERTVRALRERGLLQPPAFARRRGPPRTRVAAAAAAGVALFATGVATGQWVAGRQADRTIARLEARNAAHAEALVRETGDAYVRALSSLATVNDTARGAQVAAGREAAKQGLRKAADAVVRIAPDDPVATGILAGFDEARTRGNAASGAAEGQRRTVWF